MDWCSLQKALPCIAGRPTPATPTLFSSAFHFEHVCQMGGGQELHQLADVRVGVKSISVDSSVMLLF